MTDPAADRLAVIETCARMAWLADERDVANHLVALAAEGTS